MTFPVQFRVGSHVIPAHLVFEIAAYTVGFQLYLLLRRRQASVQKIPAEAAMWIIVGCVFGALVGSKVLAWIESAPEYLAALRAGDPAFLGGKTIVGGLLGGWIGVEVAKRLLKIRRSTGDIFVFPLILGIAIGRIGCFLTGLPDHTYGTHTRLPWAVDFGDGPRHPTQLYEIAFLLLFGAALLLRARKSYVNGELFRFFMLSYLGFRFFVEFIKPSFKPYLGLSAIQVACSIGFGAAAVGLWRMRQRLDSPSNKAVLSGISP